MTPERRILEVLARAERELYGLDLVAAGAAKHRWLYNKCGLVDNLTQEQKLAIGEARVLTPGPP